MISEEPRCPLYNQSNTINIFFLISYNCCHGSLLKSVIPLLEISVTLILCWYSEVLGEFMEGRGAVSPGILTLTTGLSKPFMRLDKYPTLLKELERHMEVCI